MRYLWRDISQRRPAQQERQAAIKAYKSAYRQQEHKLPENARRYHDLRLHDEALEHVRTLREQGRLRLEVIVGGFRLTFLDVTSQSGWENAVELVWIDAELWALTSGEFESLVQFETIEARVVAKDVWCYDLSSRRYLFGGP